MNTLAVSLPINAQLLGFAKSIEASTRDLVEANKALAEYGEKMAQQFKPLIDRARRFAEGLKKTPLALLHSLKSARQKVSKWLTGLLNRLLVETLELNNSKTKTLTRYLGNRDNLVRYFPTSSSVNP